MLNSLLVNAISSSFRHAVCSSISITKSPISNFLLAEIFALRSKAPIRKNNSSKALSFYERAYNAACDLGEIYYQVSSIMAIGDFYYFAKDSVKALQNYLLAQKTAIGKISEKNMQKINRRIEDMKLQLGEAQFDNIVDGMANGTK